MNRTAWIFKTVLFLFICSSVTPAHSQVRIKDLTRLNGIDFEPLVGYGLVIGLNGSGDTKRSEFTTQSIVNMLQRFGVSVSKDKVKPKNVAAVMVTAEAALFASKGDRMDVTVSSIGDAKSLQGGILLMTPLVDAAGKMVASAQGSVVLGGFSVETSGGGGVRQNHTQVGRVPGGASIKDELGGTFQITESLRFSLIDKDMTTTQRIIQAINSVYGDGVAVPDGPYSIAISIPQAYPQQADWYRFITEVQALQVEPDINARVVINERTGTVVIGGEVILLPAAISHGNLSVEITSSPIVSQPAPFSQGQTAVVPNTQATVYQDEGEIVTIDGAATVQEVSRVLNAIGLLPRDVIAVLQALRQAGALQAELVIM